MAVNIFERYGIKEVANVYFEALEAEKEAGIAKGDIVLYLDTLKVSTIETTAENVSAQGGWGNPKLVTWDYGKDINVTLEDAVISWEEMRILMGAQMNKATAEKPLKIRKNALVVFEKDTEEFKVELSDGLTNKGKNNMPASEGIDAIDFKFVDMTNGARGSAKIGTDGIATFFQGEVAYEPDVTEGPARVRFFWEDDATEEAKNATELIISPDRYPGTYRVVGDALIRSEKTGNDEAFQFVIEKAKMLSEVTLTMQAEGDPSTFNMTLNVLRDEDNNMMRLIKY